LQVRGLISQGRKEDAMKAAVANPPVTGDEAAKVRQ